jgi:hypothetical protein
MPQSKKTIPQVSPGTVTGRPLRTAEPLTRPRPTRTN